MVTARVFMVACVCSWLSFFACAGQSVLVLVLAALVGTMVRWKLT